MDKELEKQAIITFVQQPEVYAEFLNNNGQDGSQIPVEKIKKDPDTYVQAFQKDKEFHDTVVGLFQAIIKNQQNTSMFREGGKFDYLKKLQGGGRNAESNFNIQQKDTDKEAKRSARKNAKRVPDSNRAYNRKIGAAVSNFGSPTTLRGGNQYVYEGATVGSPGFGTTTDTYITITPELDTLIEQTFPTHSGSLTKNYKQGDPQYYKIINDLRSTGIFDALKSYTVVPKEQEGGIINDNDEGPGLGTLYAGWDSTGMWKSVPKAKRYFMRHDYSNGSSRFEEPVIEDIIGGDNMIRSRLIKLNTNDTTYFPSKASFIQALRSNETFGNKKENWITLDKERMKLRKDGGKLAKENEANKKYIKASEKAGREASKKMTDLKNKHKAELKKIK